MPLRFRRRKLGLTEGFVGFQYYYEASVGIKRNALDTGATECSWLYSSYIFCIYIVSHYLVISRVL